MFFHILKVSTLKIETGNGLEWAQTYNDEAGGDEINDYLT